MQAMVYGYDQLHRIVQARSLTEYGSAGFTERVNPVMPYDVDYTYDANGNLLTLQRLDENTSLRDDLTYEYNIGTNRLRNINPNDGENYTYDEIGNLISDAAEDIESIAWTPSGKVRSVHKVDNTSVSFRYDAAGNRIAKIASGDTTVYVRDASGNVMGVYKNDTLIEQSIYGSSRLGLMTASSKSGYRTLGGKKYELSNHLGNVMAVVSDKINMDQDSTWVNVVNVTDYYPFGLAMEGRTRQDSTYRYGFGGQEKDDEIYGAGRSYTAEFWQYDSRLGRRWNVDPLAHKRVSWSPYNAKRDNPILNIDPTGALDHEYTVDKNTGEKKQISNLGGDEVDFIHYGNYSDNGTAFKADRTVTAERAAPKENLGFVGENIKSKVNSNFEKYSFERYWKGKGDYHTQASEFDNIVANSKVEETYSPIKINENLTVTPKLVSFYGSDEYDGALGRATLFYNPQGTAIGLMDVYDFDSKPFGVRSFSNEMKTRAVKTASPSGAKPFHIWFGIVPPQSNPNE